MSHVTVYGIDAEGVPFPAAKVVNSHAGALWIWRVLDAKYDPGVPFNMLRPACWARCNARTLEPADALVCAFTFDGVWVAHADLPALADVLDAFYATHGAATARTLIGIAAALRDLAARDDVRGACFQQTSLVEDAWRLPAGEAGGEDRPFVFGRNAVNRHGRAPWNLFEEFGPAKPVPSP